MKDQLEKISSELEGASKMHGRQAAQIKELVKRAAKKAMEA